MRRASALISALACVAVTVAGCAGQARSTDSGASSGSEPAGSASATTERTAMRVAALAGPTGLGLVQLMSDNDAGTTANDYSFTIENSPDAIVSDVTSGSVDAAAVPSNLAPLLYAKTNKSVRLLNINTLGVLHLIENGDTIHSVADLKGKTIAVSGQGTTVEYALDYILTGAGLTPGTDVTLDWKSEHAEVATLLTAGQADIAVLPEPYVSTVMSKDSHLRDAINLTDAWSDPNSDLVMGVMIVNADFATRHPEAVKNFLAEEKTSIDAVNANPSAAGHLAEKYGVIASADIAAKAIPNCSITFLDGAAMASTIKPFYQVLFAADPKSIGGAMPDDDFYYQE